MTGFGIALKAERARCGKTLESISAQTKVSVRHLEALEAENFAALPGGVFRRGIARAYLVAVGLDEAPWMHSFEQSLGSFQGAAGLSPELDSREWESFAENVRRSRQKDRRRLDPRWIGLLAMSGTLAAAAWVVWHFVLQSRMPS